jgi:hypothetical protein
MVRTENDRNLILEATIDSLDVPSSYYARAVERYSSIGEWLHRSDSTVAGFAPAVYSQGSFRLGTVVRPLLPSHEYDLDIVCHLRALSKLGITQQKVKELVGKELQLYASAHGLKAPVEECPRCWRFYYADDLSFHIDTVPCIPEDEPFIRALTEAGVDPTLAKLAIALTCRTHPDYGVLCSDWPTGNPSGYARWFEGRFSQRALSRRRQLLKEGVYASIEAIPLYALKTPLQRAIQFLKRHRDVMFHDAIDLKPVSIILTTLAALSYEGEDEPYETVQGILRRIPEHVHPSSPRIANPVNPAEDFADRWSAKPELEKNFWLWYKRVIRDLDAMVEASDPAQLQKLTESRFSVELPSEKAKSLLGTASGVVVSTTYPQVRIDRPPKPWGDNAKVWNSPPLGD